MVTNITHGTYPNILNIFIKSINAHVQHKCLIVVSTILQHNQNTAWKNNVSQDSNTNLNLCKLAKPNRIAAGYQEILLLQ
jgi:hypothetical protein